MKTILPAALLLTFPTLALAQDNSLNPPPAPATVVVSTSVTDGGHGLGVGAEQTLGGATGAAVVWDADRWHADFMLGLDHQSDPDTTAFGVGARFLYLIHKTSRSDLGLGVGFSIVHFAPNTGTDETNIQFEALAQARVFLVPNVAVSAALGFVVVTADNILLTGGPVTTTNGDAAFGIGGNVLATFGFTYFFR